jgi:mannose-6-phosphate isomerase-like protein (cupin superfamily)
MTIALFLLLAFQQPTGQAPARPPATTQTPAQPGAATPAPAAPRRVVPTTATLEIRVVDRSGRPISDAHVVVQGPTSREDTTDKSGTTTFKTMTAGSYRVRAEGDGYVALEKEIPVKGAVAPQQVLLSLSAAPVAPPPEPKVEPPPPPPPPGPALSMGTPGEPRSLSIPDLAEHSLGGKDPIKVFPIGCSGASQSRLIVLRDAIPAGTNKDADETLYVVAGEATLTLGSAKEQPIAPGWFTIVPRGTSYAIGRKGRNPAILLSTVFGRPCNTTSTSHQ